VYTASLMIIILLRAIKKALIMIAADNRRRFDNNLISDLYSKMILIIEVALTD
jgi:hypothetical protein